MSSKAGRDEAVGVGEERGSGGGVSLSAGGAAGAGVAGAGDGGEDRSAPSRGVRCGYCGGPVELATAGDFPGRCVCGARAVTQIPGGTLVHAEGCEGGHDCPCFEALEGGRGAFPA